MPQVSSIYQNNDILNDMERLDVTEREPVLSSQITAVTDLPIGFPVASIFMLPYFTCSTRRSGQRPELGSHTTYRDNNHGHLRPRLREW